MFSSWPRDIDRPAADSLIIHAPAFRDGTATILSRRPTGRLTPPGVRRRGPRSSVVTVVTTLTWITATSDLRFSGSAGLTRLRRIEVAQGVLDGPSSKGFRPEGGSWHCVLYFHAAIF